MRAYKCDICGCYCDDVYKIDDDIFENSKNGIETIVKLGEKIGNKR